MGWFFPSAEAEALMPDIVDPLIGSYFQVSSKTAGEPLTLDEVARLAEFEKACERVASRDLHIRREDGSRIPTESVGIRDVEALLSCYRETDLFEDDLDDDTFFFDDDPSEAWKRRDEVEDDEAEDALRADIEHDMQLIDEWIEQRAERREWSLDDDEPLPRYQIIALLSDPSAVP
jgi:hypothetical protein